MSEATGSFMDADFWHSVQNAARQEVARSACQLIRAEVVAKSGTKVNVRREYSEEPDGIFYPVLDALVVPSVGQYVWCIQRVGGLIVLGRNLDASDKLQDYATGAVVDERIAALKTNDVQGTTLPSEYPPTSVSVKIRGGGTGFPTPSGTLVTFGSGHSNSYAYTTQMWFPAGTAQTWVRSGTTENTWGEWRNLSVNTFTPTREWRTVVAPGADRLLTHDFGRLPYLVTGWMRADGTTNDWRLMPTSPTGSGLDVYITESGSNTMTVRNTSGGRWELIVYAY